MALPNNTMSLLLARVTLDARRYGRCTHGLKTALITMNLDLIAQMSCNPALAAWPRDTWCASGRAWRHHG